MQEYYYYMIISKEIGKRNFRKIKIQLLSMYNICPCGSYCQSFKISKSGGYYPSGGCWHYRSVYCRRRNCWYGSDILRRSRGYRDIDMCRPCVVFNRSFVSRYSLSGVFPDIFRFSLHNDVRRSWVCNWIDVSHWQLSVHMPKRRKQIREEGISR